MSLEEYLLQKQQAAWDRIRNLAPRYAHLLDDEMLDWLAGRIDQAPHSYCALLLDVAAADEHRQEQVVKRFRQLLPAHAEAALSAAGYNLHRYCRLLDGTWIDDALRYVDVVPEGAWGIFTAAAMYQPSAIAQAHLDGFTARRAAFPREYCTALLALAGHRPEQARELLAAVMPMFISAPLAAVTAAAAVASDQAALQTSELVSAVRRHADADPEQAWKFLAGVARMRPDICDDAWLDELNACPGPGTLFTIVRHLMDVHPLRLSGLMDRYVALVRRYPEAGINDAFYSFQHDSIKLVRPDLIAVVCASFATNPYHAYDILWRCVTKRPELISRPEVEAALLNVEHATNRAFTFFRELVSLRPEFTRECILGFFEALAREPVHRAFFRAEEMEGIIALADTMHMRTGIESALREPPQVGSQRARALMAMMFRQKLRARRRVLLESLRYAATTVLWHTDKETKFSPIWDFILFIIDNSGADAISTAAAERFLEGSFQLHYLCENGHEHETFLRKLTIQNPPVQPFPAAVAFLDQETDLAQLYHLVLELGRRFEVVPRITPLQEFAQRLADAETELRAIASTPAAAGRRKNLELSIACWKDPQYAEAFMNPATAERLSAPARDLLKREKKGLIKRTRDALRAEAINLTVVAMERLRHELFRTRLHELLGQEVAIEQVEASVLPAFLWLHAVSGMANNSAYLKRLICDRITHQPHDWLRNEPQVVAWSQRFPPEVQLARWRAFYEQEVQYRPKDALAEKRRRMQADLAQARQLLEQAGATGIASLSYEALTEQLAALRSAQPPSDEQARKEWQAPDPVLLDEVAMNLERVRVAEQTPDSDFQGSITLTVESDPFEILFMGEYGFASCLSLRGSNSWAAVSNAIDIDKTVVWAKDAGGNVVGRRLIALTPTGILVYRTYTNRHGLSLDAAFDRFIAAYAVHCGTTIRRGGQVGPLLSDRWYDDRAM